VGIDDWGLMVAGWGIIVLETRINRRVIKCFLVG
jgi:hypothetical protein